MKMKGAVSGQGRKGLTSCSDDFLLSCSLVSLSSAVPRRDSVFSKVQEERLKKTHSFLFQKVSLSVNSSLTFGDTTKLGADGLFWPGGTGVLGCVATGLAGTGVLGSEDKLSVSFFNSMPMGIRSGELSFPLTCSNSCTCVEEIRWTVNLNPSHTTYARRREPTI